MPLEPQPESDRDRQDGPSASALEERGQRGIVAGAGSADCGRVATSALLRARPLYGVGLLALLALLAFHAVSLGRADVPTWGWDESMHAELPAARMALHARAGEPGAAAEVLLECQQYPFVFPALLAATQAVFGVSETVARGTALALWYVFGLIGLALLGLELARSMFAPSAGARPERPAPLGLVLLLPLLALSSPLVGRFAPTLFLEVPFLALSAFALRAWLRRRSLPPSAWREFAAGAWVMAAFFTKFNYGLLFGAALALDWLIDAYRALRTGAARAYLRRSIPLVSAPLVLFVWWFVLPLPGGFDVARAHREAFAGFLGGNLELGRTPWNRRLLDWGGGVAPNPYVLSVIVFVAVASSARYYSLAVWRTLWILLLVTGLPVWLHPFHLDRFLIPGSLALWCLACVGSVVPPPRENWPWEARLRAASLLGGAAIVAALSWRFPIDTFAKQLGLVSDDIFQRTVQVPKIRAQWRLGGTIQTSGLERAGADALFDAIAADVGPDLRVGWLGQSSEVAPAVLHLGLFARGGSRERFLRDAVGPMDVTSTPGEAIERIPDAELDAWASAFDVILITDPVDLKGRASRAAVREAWHVPLVELGWLPTRIAELPVAGREITLYACRRQ